MAHNEFVNCIEDISSDYYATGGSDSKVNLWSKQTLALIESFEVPGEVASMTRAAGDQLVCGLINGTLAVIDVGKLQIARILERAHTGTVVACLSLKQSSREIVIT